MQTRREFILILSALAAGAAFRRSGAAALLDPATAFPCKPLADVPDGYVIGALGDGGNVLALMTDDGPIIVDAKFAHTAGQLASDLKVLFDAQPALVINTHHHFDHSGGNWIFGDRGRIIAHKNFNPRLEANLAQYASDAEAHVDELKQANAGDERIKAAADVAQRIKGLGAKDFAADEELNDGVTIIDFGGQRLQLYHYGHGHTDNDVVVFFPGINILHMGDLVFNGLHPYVDRGAKANSKGWQASLRQALNLGDDKTIVIPGHGEVTTKTALSKQIEYFDQLRSVVEAEMKQGKSREHIAAMQPDVFRGLGFEMLQSRALAAMYDEIAESAH